VYRIRFGNGAPASWQMERIAAFGCNTPAACTANRKFMFAPSVVTTGTISMDATYHLMLGSGDREKPTGQYSASNAVANHFFQFTDKPGDSGFPGSADCGANVVCMASLQPITGSVAPTPAQLAAKKGWSLALAATEQVVTSAVTVFGVTTFSSHKPSVATTGCSRHLGEARVYNVNYANAAPAYADSRADLVAGGGLPPSPVAGQVTLDDGVTVPFCIGCSKDSPLEARLPTSLGAASKPKGRLYWYVEK
jgi:type IV pilus assembly protein PilY1